MDFEEITGGYSGAKLLRLRYAGKDRCVKIMPRGLEERSARRVREICEIYRKVGIDSLSLRGYGELDEGRHFYIYDYIEGESFKEYSNRELSRGEIRKAGTELGRKLRVLKEFEDYENDLIQTDDTKQLTLSGQELYKSLTNDAAVSELMWKYFEQGQIEELMQEFMETAEVFAGVKPGLIHGDLKRSNMVKGQDGKIYLIDIESMRRSYDVLNLRYQMTWILFAGAEKEREFVRGIFDGLYDGVCGEGRPGGFSRMLRYVLMLNFVEHTTKAWRRGEDLREYFENMREVFEEVAAAGDRSLL